MSIKTNALFVISAFALSACFGSSDSSDDLEDRGEDLAGRFTNSSATPMDDPALQSGKASYTGVAGFIGGSASRTRIADDAEVISTVKLNADFDAGRIGGTLSGFEATDDDAGTGRIVKYIADDTVTMTEATITGNTISGGGLEGKIKNPDGEFTITGDWSGEFRGEGAKIVGGDINATAQFADPLTVSGAYAAEKDAK